MSPIGGVQRGYRAESGREFRENDAAGPVGVVVGSVRPDRIGFGAGGLCRLPQLCLFERFDGGKLGTWRAHLTAREKTETQSL